MNFDEIQRKMEQALNQLLENDRYLLEHDINEPTISHRLALYLENRFPPYNVDCEYNGDIDGRRERKYISLLKEDARRYGILKEDEETDELIYRGVYPDIIVHQRGNNKNNLLIIEIKKSSNKSDGSWDMIKLNRYTSNENDNHFNYDYGVFIRFIIGDAPSYTIEWFHINQD